MKDIHAAFARSVRDHGSRAFIHVPLNACKDYAPAPIELSYDSAWKAVEGLRSRYAQAGFGGGDRVALVLDNRADFFLHFLALNGVGASVVPVSAEMQADEIRYLVAHSQSALVVSLPEHLSRMKEILPETPVVDAHRLDMDDRQGEAVADLEEAALLYTSGTTGKPKGCILSNEYFLECGRWYNSQGGYCVVTTGVERLITPLPLNHSNAMAWSFMAMMMSGGCVVQLDRFHPATWWNSVRASQATIIHYLGVMPAMLLKQEPSADERFGDQIKFAFGAGVDPRHHAAFEERFEMRLIEAWAMTESGPAAVIAANREPRHVGTRCIGRPDPGLECRLVDEEGQDVAIGMPGELLIRGKGAEPRRYFFSGYYGDREATDAAWADGWFHTGDVVRADDEGYYYFVDRRKNIIRRSGENIAAVEVEGILLRHPAIKTCAVAPVSDDIRGEEVAACIVLQEGVAPGESLAREIFTHSLNALVYFKAPGYIAFVPALPMTASQKIQRGELKKLAQQLVLEPDIFDLRAHKRRPKAAQAS